MNLQLSNIEKDELKTVILKLHKQIIRKVAEINEMGFEFQILEKDTNQQEPNQESNQVDKLKSKLNVSFIAALNKCVNENKSHNAKKNDKKQAKAAEEIILLNEQLEALQSILDKADNIEYENSSSALLSSIAKKPAFLIPPFNNQHKTQAQALPEIIKGIVVNLGEQRVNKNNSKKNIESIERADPSSSAQILFKKIWKSLDQKAHAHAHAEDHVQAQPPKKIAFNFCGSFVRGDEITVANEIFDVWKTNNPGCPVYVLAGPGATSSKETAPEFKTYKDFITYQAKMMSPSKNLIEARYQGQGGDEQIRRALEFLELTLPQNRSSEKIDIEIPIIPHSRGGQNALRALPLIVERCNEKGYNPKIKLMSLDPFQLECDYHFFSKVETPPEVTDVFGVYAATEKNPNLNATKLGRGTVIDPRHMHFSKTTDLITIALNIGHMELANSDADTWDESEQFFRGFSVNENGKLFFKQPEDIRKEAAKELGKLNNNATSCQNQSLSDLIKDFNAFDKKESGSEVTKEKLLEKLKKDLIKKEKEFKKEGLSDGDKKYLKLLRAAIFPEHKYARDLVKQCGYSFFNVFNKDDMKVFQGKEYFRADIENILTKEIEKIKTTDQMGFSQRHVQRQKPLWTVRLDEGTKNNTWFLKEAKASVFSKETKNIQPISVLHGKIKASDRIREGFLGKINATIQSVKNTPVHKEAASKKPLFHSWTTNNRFVRQWVARETAAEAGYKHSLNDLASRDSSKDIVLSDCSEKIQNILQSFKRISEEHQDSYKEITTKLLTICNGNNSNHLEKVLALQQRTREFLVDGSISQGSDFHKDLSALEKCNIFTTDNAPVLSPKNSAPNFA